LPVHIKLILNAGWGLIIVLCLAVFVNSCGKSKEKTSPSADRTNIESDYVGKIATLMEMDSLTARDSLRLLQYVYQAASLDTRLYDLHVALIKSYFWACHEKCEKQRCSTGNILALAVAYALDGDLDSATAIADLSNRELLGKSAEAGELVRLIRFLSEHQTVNELMQPYYDGLIKTPAAIGFWAIMTLNKGISPDEWIASLAKEQKKSDSPSLKYAFAFAHYKAGNTSLAWHSLPDYLPLAKSFPPPSFSEEVAIGDSTYSQKLYLSVDSYVVKQIRQAFLKNLLEQYPDQNSANVKALTALAKIKDLEQFQSISFPAIQRGGQSAENPAEQLLEAIQLSQSSTQTSAVDLGKLKDAVSRAAFLKSNSDKITINDSDNFKKLLLAEIDSSRGNRVWESKILLSLALRKTVSASEAFSKLNNFGVSDLSVRNNSPEWLAIYAAAGLEESSQMALVSQIGFNLTQHYPYAIGIYELMQNLNHICKYY
jgi:hypothetical protein